MASPADLQRLMNEDASGRAVAVRILRKGRPQDLTVRPVDLVSPTPQEVIAEEFSVSRFFNVDVRPRYNVAPSQLVETSIEAGDERSLGPMRWGFVPPPMAKDPKLSPINARAETRSTSPKFRDAFRRHRCLEVADGFIHNRMPVILPPGARDRWLDPGPTKQSFVSYSLFFRASSSRSIPFSAVVNAPRNDSPECMQPIAGILS